MHGTLTGTAAQKGQVTTALTSNEGKGQTLSAASLETAAPVVQKQMFGDKLCLKVTKNLDMMLELDTSELLILLESDVRAKGKADEAARLLRN